MPDTHTRNIITTTLLVLGSVILYFPTLAQRLEEEPPTDSIYYVTEEPDTALLDEDYYYDEYDYVESEIAYDSSVITVRSPDNATLEEFRNDPDFVYDRVPVVEYSWWDIFLRKLQNWFGDLILAGTSNPFVIALCVLVAIILIVWIVKAKLSGMFGKKSAHSELGFNEVTENIHEMSFDQLIATAVSDRDYRRAIRLHYLKLLKQLADSRDIEWRPEKTNRDYLRELAKSDFRDDFEHATMVFEYAWYGDIDIDENIYNTARVIFTPLYCTEEVTA